MYTRLQSSRAFVYKCAERFDAGNKSIIDASSAFLYTSKNSIKCAEDCINICGLNGYIKDFPSEKLYRDSLFYDIVGANNQMRQWLVGRELYKLYYKNQLIHQFFNLE